MTDRWRPARPDPGISELSAEDVAARIGSGEAQAGRVGNAAPAARVLGVPPRPVARRPADRRRMLWVDTATIVGGVLISLLAFQLLGSGGQGPGPVADASPTAQATGVRTGTRPPPVTLPPPQTLGPVVDPSLGIDATPTPIPVITLGPTPRTTPTPNPSATAAAPVAGFTWVQLTSPAYTIDFTNTSTGQVTSYLWNYDDGTTSANKAPNHTFPSAGPYQVRLTVSGPGGSDAIVIAVIVEPPPTASPDPTAAPTEAPTESPTESPIVPIPAP